LLFHLEKNKYEKDGYLICETKDFVEIGLRADVFYKIEDSSKVLFHVGKDKIEPLVRDTAIATLNSIIRSTSLSQIAQNKEITVEQSKNVQAPQFYEKLHDEFIGKLREGFLHEFGIDIKNIRIESFKIVNQQLADNISKQAFTTAQTETQLSNLAGQTEIATTQQLREANLSKIKAEGEAIRLKTETDAKNKAKMDSARIDAESLLLLADSEAKSQNFKVQSEVNFLMKRAEAEAKSLELKAKAESEAILLKAESESKRSEMLSQTTLGGQMALFEMYSNMVKKTMKGVDKVIYLPSEMSGNPFNFYSMENGPFSGFQNIMQNNNTFGMENTSISTNKKRNY